MSLSVSSAPSLLPLLGTASNVVRMASRLTPELDVTVQDSASRIMASLSHLQSLAVANKLDAVTLTDSTSLTFKASQFANTTALRPLLNATIQVVDTAANVANTNLVGAASVTVKDSAAGVLRNFEAMRTKAANGSLGAVVLTDKKPALTLTAAQYVGSADLRALLKNVSYTIQDTADAVAMQTKNLTGLNVSITDTSANIQNNLDTLQSLAADGKLKTLKFTDSASAKLTMTVDQVRQLGSVVSVGIQLKDTAAKIQNNFDTLAAFKKITAIELTDTAKPTLQLSEAQYKKGSNLLAKISGAAVTVQFSGNYGDYKIKANADGSYVVGNTKYKGVTDFSFRDLTTFADTGDSNLNAMLFGGTNYWWRNTAQTFSRLGTEIKTGVYALAEGSSRQTFTYSFLDQQAVVGTVDNVKFKEMSDTQRKAVRDAFTYLSSIIDVTFVESQTPGKADINFGTNDQTATKSSGYANVPNGSGEHPVFLFLDNSKTNTNGNLKQGTYGWQTLLHEIGHTLGLKHPGNYNAAGGGSPGPFLPKATDSRQYTLMSYFNAANATASPSTFMMYDMAALQFLYGVGSGEKAKDYQVTSFTADWSGLETLWAPSGGVMDASAVINANIIDLREGAFSSINVKANTAVNFNNVGLAYGSQVTLAKGGSANDVFYLSAENDVTIDGGGGADTAYLAGTQADWVVSQGRYVNERLSRTVTLMGVEHVKYYDAVASITTHSQVDFTA